MKHRGVAMMMIGNALDHPIGTYELYNPNTCRIIVSNSVIWKDFNRWEATKAETFACELFKGDSYVPVL